MITNQAAVIRIRPRNSWQWIDFRELWLYRELLYFFVWRDVKVRYKQTVLGALWAIIQPLSTTFLFTIVFGWLGGMSAAVKGPYSLYVFAGLLPWTFFSNAVGLAANSLVGSSHLISKVYFPRILVPVASIAAGLVDFAISFAALGVLMMVYGVLPSPAVLLVPVFLAGTIAAASGAGLLFSALIVTYRDFRYVAAFVVQLWLYATPVLYALDVIPASWRVAYALNPMVGMIAGFRSCMLGEPFAWPIIFASGATTVVLLLVGASYFVQVERRFADVV